MKLQIFIEMIHLTASNIMLSQTIMTRSVPCDDGVIRHPHIICPFDDINDALWLKLLSALLAICRRGDQSSILPLWELNFIKHRLAAS